MKLLLLISVLLTSICSLSQKIKTAVPDKVVVLTFDDGVKSHYSFVAPLLKQHGFGATFFVCEFPPDFTDTTKYMTWLQMQSLDKMGFEVANHTRTHQHVNKMDSSTMAGELAYIEAKMDSLGMRKPVSFAYPGYDTHPTALKVLKAKGYRFARAGFDRLYDPATDHPYLIPGFTTRTTNKELIMQAIRGAKDGKIAVLTIHGVPDLAHEWVTTPPELFLEYLAFLKTNNYTVIALKDLSKYIDPQKFKTAN